MRLSLIADPTVIITATTVSGSANITVADTTSVAGALRVTGTGIPPDTLVDSTTSATVLKLTKNATASGTPTLTFLLEPVTLQEAKLHLRQAITDDDLLIADLITTARQQCETYKSRSFIHTTWDLLLDSFPGHQLRFGRTGFPGQYNYGIYGQPYHRDQNSITVPRCPLASVTSLKYYDTTGTLITMDAANYLVSFGTPGRISPIATSSCWPMAQQRTDAVQIRFTAGFWGTALNVPSCVKSAMKLLIGHLYENREQTVPGTTIVDLPSGVMDVLSPVDFGSYI